MSCLHETSELIDNALDSAFENYGRAVFFEEDTEKIKEIVQALVFASFELDEYLEEYEEEPDQPKEVKGVSET
jgi:hypothetical protein